MGLIQRIGPLIFSYDANFLSIIRFNNMALQWTNPILGKCLLRNGWSSWSTFLLHRLTQLVVTHTAVPPKLLAVSPTREKIPPFSFILPTMPRDCHWKQLSTFRLFSCVSFMIFLQHQICAQRQCYNQSILPKPVCVIHNHSLKSLMKTFIIILWNHW